MQKAGSRHAEGIRRQRAINSCRACRARRVKCDKVHPTCGRCAKSGDICLYIDNHRRSGSQSKPNGLSVNVSPVERSLPQPAGEPWSPDSPNHQGVPQATDALEILENIEKRRADENAFQNGGSTSGDNDDDAGDSLSGHLAVRNGGRSRYVGNTFWAYVGDEVYFPGY